MSFEARIWREVGRHGELDESVRRMAPILGNALPIDALIVRRLERDPMRLTTVALGSTASAGSIEPRATRSELGAETRSLVESLLREERAVFVSSHDAPALHRVLVPPDLAGDAIVGPLLVKGVAVGIFVLLLRADSAAALTPQHLSLAQDLIEPLSAAFENDQGVHELARLREALEADRQALLSRLGRQDISDTIVGATAGLRGVMERCEQVARTDAPVLILGETGSGKEVIARTIHGKSRRMHGPIVRINCGAIPPELIDSELFGHERGSFTGAVATRKGWFERADGGTLFLDEIGELPMAAQVRLLRVLQDGSLERVGGQNAITVDVRIVAATHRNLETMVAEGRFREDLWYRISVFPIRLPPLREREQDIPALATHFARRAGERLGGSPLIPSAQDLALLCSYPWPGNVRELAAVLERAAILGDGKRLEVGKALGVLDPAALTLPRLPSVPQRGTPPPIALPEQGALLPSGAVANGALAPLERAMREHIEQALQATHGRIEGQFGAAKLLGINPHTLRARMRKLGIEWARYRQHEH